MPLLTQRAYGRHRAELGLTGTTHRAVQKAIERGRISKNADGLIDSGTSSRAPRRLQHLLELQATVSRRRLSLLELRRTRRGSP